MFDNINVNPHKNEGFPTSIPCIPISEYGQSNAHIEASLDVSSLRIQPPLLAHRLTFRERKRLPVTPKNSIVMT